MSGIHITVEESIKLNMMRYFNCSEIDEIVLTDPRAPESPLLSGFDRIVDVAYREQTRTIGYDRFNVSNMFESSSAYMRKTTISAVDKPTAEKIYPYLLSDYGIDIPESEIDYSNSAIVDDKCTFVMKKDSKYYTGAFTFRLSNGANSYPRPMHEFFLMGNLKNTGTSGKNMTAPFKFVTDTDGKWATLTGGRTPYAFGNGVEFPTIGNWTLDFEFMVKSRSAYNSIFSEQIPGTYIPGCLCFYNGLFYEAYITHGTHGKVVPINTTTRHTVVCKNNVISYYYNGDMVETWRTQTSRTALRCFRNTSGGDEQFAENVSHIRKLRFWDTAVDGTDLDNLFKDKGPVTPLYPTPDHEWLLNGDTANTGVGNDSITDKFKFVELPSGMWGTLTQGRTPVRITASDVLVRTGNWCVDFEMLDKVRPLRNTIFNSGYDSFNANSLMFYENRLYVPYGNSGNIHNTTMPLNTPTRHTLRCISGTINYYMNGTLVQTWPSATGTWNYFRSTFGETEQMEEDKTYLRNIRFWKDGMDDLEFKNLLNEIKPPVHHWPLEKDTKNIGTSPAKPPFAPPVEFSTMPNGAPMANLVTSGDHPLGTTFDGSGNWTIAARVVDPSPGLKAFITSETSETFGVTSVFFRNKFSTYLGSDYADNWWVDDYSKLMHANKRHSVVLTKSGLNYRMYNDGVLIQSCRATKPVVNKLGRFGMYEGGHALDTGFKFSDVRIYDYCMTDEQVKMDAAADKYKM